MQTALKNKRGNLHTLSNCILSLIGFKIDPYIDKGYSLRCGNGVIKPTKEKGEPLLGSDALMVAIPSDLQYIVDLSHAERAATGKSHPFKLFIINKENDLPCGLAGPLLGAPQAAIVMEKLIALGARRIWLLGWCGSLQKNMVIGNLIIPTTALSEEGTSAHYQVNHSIKQTDPSLNKRLGAALEKTNISFKKGPVWTTDALYRETAEKVTAYGKRGYLAVEMELSALITVAIYRSVQLAGLLIVSDELSSLQWHHGFGSASLKKASREAGRLLLSLCMDEQRERKPINMI
jgi:purine-nucleoside phosphorylase